MRIAFILPSRATSGGVIVTCAMANKLISRGHNVRIFYKKAKLTPYSICRKAALNLLYHRGHDGLRDFKGEARSFRSIHKVNFHKDEILIGAGMWASVQLTKLKGISNPKLQYIHGQHIGTDPADAKLTDIALSSPLPKIVVSSFLKPFVESFGGGPVLGVVPNGIDTKKFYCSINSGQKRYVGTIYSSHPAKDPKTIMQVIDRLVTIHHCTEILVFGSGRRPRELNRINYFRLPSLKKIRQIYSESLVWVVVSKSEGFSVPTLEAMACGAAVVATDCGGVRDIIQDGINGFLVEVGDVEKIVDRVLLLRKNSSLRKKMCQEAKKTVLRFNWDTAALKLEVVLEKLIKPHGF